MFKIYVYNGKIGAEKLSSIIALKGFLKIGLKEAKNWFDELPKSLVNQTLEDVEFYKTHFKCDVIDMTPSQYTSNYNIRGQRPCQETKDALDWYETLDSETKAKIDLIGEWNNQPLVAVC